MKNSTKILLIVASCLIILGSVLAAGAVIFTPGGFPALIQRMGSSSYTAGWTASGLYDWENVYSSDNRYETDAALSGLDIDWNAGNVTLTLYDGKNIVFEEQSDQVLDAEHALRYGIKDGTLYIQYCRKGLVTQLPVKNLTVYIPRADFFETITADTASADIYAQGLFCSRFCADTTSGNIGLSGFHTAHLEISSTSGTLHAAGIFDEIKAGSTSGEITLALSAQARSVHCSTTSGVICITGDLRKLDMQSTSGDLRLEGKAQEAEFDTISGEISVVGEVGSFDAESTSGKVLLAVSGAAPQELEISTVSGDVLLKLPENADFTLDYDTVSGDFDSDLSVSLKNHRYVCGNGMADYEVETTSGNLTIQNSR